MTNATPTQYTEKPDECDSCGWPTTDLVEVDAYARDPEHGPFTPEEKKKRGWLCEVCLATLAGNAYCYPRQYENVQILQTLAMCTNMILAAIREKR